MLDILPTLAALAGAAGPNQKIDGHDIRPLILGEAGAVSPSDAGGFFYYQMRQLQAVRGGPWKLYLPLAGKRINLSTKRAPAALALYNVRDDVAEERELSAQHPDLVQRLLKLAEQARADLGDEEGEGAGQRPAGWAAKPSKREAAKQ